MGEPAGTEEEELLYLIRQGEETALGELLARYDRRALPMVVSLLRQQNCYEKDDARAAARSGVLSALESYREDRSASFAYFAGVCAEREVRSLLRHERRKGIYTNYRTVSLDQQLKEDDGAYLIDYVTNNQPQYDPLWKSRKDELDERLARALGALGERERLIWRLWQAEHSYADIAERTGLSVKKVDYQLQKIKALIRSCVDYRG